MRLLIGIVVGLFIAWNVTQPQIAKDVQIQGEELLKKLPDQLCPPTEKREVTLPLGPKEITIGCKTAAAH